MSKCIIYIIFSIILKEFFLIVRIKYFHIVRMIFDKFHRLSLIMNISDNNVYFNRLELRVSDININLYYPIRKKNKTSLIINLKNIVYILSHDYLIHINQIYNRLVKFSKCMYL
jgi:hypothetical protein